MSEATGGGAAAQFRSAGRFMAWTVLSFILLSLVLCLGRLGAGGADLQWQIRTGILRDLVLELPLGRQALVSSLWVMPLPTVCALLFVPLLPPDAYGLAYLYALALIMAPATVPLASLLRRRGVPLSGPVAMALLVGCAYVLGPTPYSDLLACVACLTIAVFFDTHKQPVLRALAGVFYGLALLSHVAGLAVAVARVAWIVVGRLTRRRDPERRAVQWIQCAGLAYVFGVYLFLNWMIMPSAAWPITHFDWHAPAPMSRQVSTELATALSTRYASFAPVVSGHWGYTVEPLLSSLRGHHFVDFHRDKVPEWERRDLVLVVPKPTNPVVGLSAMAAEMHRNPAAVSGYLLLSETPNWEFYLVVTPQEREPARTPLVPVSPSPTPEPVPEAPVSRPPPPSERPVRRLW